MNFAQFIVVNSSGVTVDISSNVSSSFGGQQIFGAKMQFSADEQLTNYSVSGCIVRRRRLCVP